MIRCFGDDTLLACIDIGKRPQTLQEVKARLKEESVSDLGKYFKLYSLLSDFANKENDVDKPKEFDSGRKRRKHIQSSDKFRG